MPVEYRSRDPQSVLRDADEGDQILLLAGLENAVDKFHGEVKQSDPSQRAGRHACRHRVRCHRRKLREA